MSGLLGSSSKSKSVQQSTSSSIQGNHAFNELNSAYAPVLGQVGQTGDFISQLLGMGGGTGANDAFQKYLGSTGYQFQLGQGSNAITGNAAARGLLHSGSTLKALNDYGQNMGGQYFNSYIQQLLGLGNQGLQAGQTLASAGQYGQSQSQSSGKSTSGSGSGLMGIPSMLGA